MRARFSLALLWAGALAGGLFWGSQSAPSESGIAFLYVGQGDCTVIRDGPRTILIDVGPGGDGFDAGSLYVAPALRRRGITQVDLLLLTHPDADHIGGLPSLRARIPIRKVVVSEAFRHHPELVRTLQAAQIEDRQVQWLREEATLSTPGCTLFVRPPKLEDPLRDNEGSLFVWVRLPGLTAVLTGDAGEETEIVQAGRGDWRADILKAGHHGSAGSSSTVWLREVHPRYSVISCGRGNRYGHPAAPALARIRQEGAAALRTDLEGDIEFVATGRGFRRRTD